MIRKILIMTTLVVVPVLFSSQARAQNAKSGDYCREYVQDVNINGKSERAFGTACLRPDGAWEIVNLEGSDYGRNKVRDIIREDIRNNADRQDYETQNRVVIVKQPSYSKRYYNRNNYYNRNHYYKRHHYNTIGFYNRKFGFGKNYGYHNKKFNRSSKKFRGGHRGKGFHRR